jgi:hypothetical protein
MEDLIHLTRNLFLTEEDSIANASGDNDYNNMVAGMLDLGQTCLMVTTIATQGFIVAIV